MKFKPGWFCHSKSGPFLCTVQFEARLEIRAAIQSLSVLPLLARVLISQAQRLSRQAEATGNPWLCNLHPGVFTRSRPIWRMIVSLHRGRWGSTVLLAPPHPSFQKWYQLWFISWG